VTKRMIEFETAGLAAAAVKAARVAPTKGVAFDKASGIILRVTDDRKVEVRATNLEIDFLEVVTPTEVEDEDEAGWDWRFPSQLLSGFLAGLPQGSGKRVTFTQDEEGPVVIQSGRTIARINTSPAAHFKQWEAFDPTELQPVTGFSSRVAQVAWATDPEAVPLSGVHIDGQHLYATDRYKMVRVPLEIAHLVKPVTVPLEKLGPILTGIEDVKIGASERQFFIMPDDYTQIAAVLFDAEYPPIDRAMKTDHEEMFHLPRLQARDAITRMLSLVGRGQRYPIIYLTIDHGTLGLEMEVDGVGKMTDEIDIDYAGATLEIKFTPTFLSAALDNAKGDLVNVAFNLNPKAAIYLYDNHGYEVWIQPRNPLDKVPVKGEDDDA
jgi:DNA polymerase III sliding clamp (beta) subunit (PCNA family)